jgi:ABC-2 type transport system permease protein
MRHFFSWQRLFAVIIKEFVQMKRDRLTFGMIIGIPLIQLILFGFAINNDPKNLLTAIVSGDESTFTRTLLIDMQNSAYFKLLDGFKSEKDAEELLAEGKIQFILFIPPRFTTDLLQQRKPSVLLEADSTDPAAASNALSAMQDLNTQINRSFAGSLQYLHLPDAAMNLTLHLKYNPEKITQYNIVPGLLGVVLTMTMVLITALAITRERERGTMESLLATPVQPVEVMLGKLIPYIVVGYIQVSFILIAARYLFNVPIHGSLILLLLACLPFIAANLSVGLTFSTIAKNQLQAMQLSFFFFLPSILLSGFMFPFQGMPTWAQAIGNILPLTHFIAIVRGILLKGNGAYEILANIAAIILFFIIVIILGVKRYRQTLD